MHKLIILVLFDMYLLSGHTEVVTSVAFSGDGSKVVSGSWDNTVKIWSADNGELIQTLSGDIDIKYIYIYIYIIQVFLCNMYIQYSTCIIKYNVLFLE
jgi:WD40 repeat protein